MCEKCGKDSQITPYDLFKISEERFEVIADTFKKHSKSCDEWKEAITKTIEEAKISGENEHILLGYLFGRLYQWKENMGLPTSLIELLRKKYN